MTVEIGLTDGPTNTQYASLAALSAHYQQNSCLEPLAQVQMALKRRDFTPVDKLVQVLVSILAGCETVSEVNTYLKSELGLAQIWGWGRFVDQSNLSRTLDGLTLMNIEQLRHSTTTIWRTHSRTVAHDWRSYLWLDFDLSGLPCSPRAEASQKGYFSGKKTSVDVNWPGSAPSPIEKPYGRMFFQAIDTPVIACSRLCRGQKMP